MNDTNTTQPPLSDKLGVDMYDNTTDTPETDEMEEYLYEIRPTEYRVEQTRLELCRKLERERDEARREAENWRWHWKKRSVMSMIVSSKLPWEKP